MNEEQQREAARLWYEKFGKERESKMTRSRARLLQVALLGFALLMVVLGLRLRSDKMERVMNDRQPPAIDESARLSRELALDGPTGQVFFPLWEGWKQAEADLDHQAGKLRERLAELSADQNDYNFALKEDLGQLQVLDSLLMVGRRQLITDVESELGLWRAARLASLLEEGSLSAD
jgi:hypothetical protein